MADEIGQTSAGRRLTKETRLNLYSARRILTLHTQEETGLRIPVEVYFKDPLVAKNNPAAAIDKDFSVPWEPGLRDGPTSARFAVVDYDATSNVLAPPALWDEKLGAYVAPAGQVLDENTKDLLQFHQVSVWAIAQNTLDFFEGGFGLGRRISWAFEGNRLIIVPHAGYGENAYYDRSSKSLQFYWFDGEHGRIYTCLSSDIVNHEFGHAVLDGLRPYFFESIAPQTAAFHEFLGDLTAILMSFRNNSFRSIVLEQSGGDLKTDKLLANLAAEFGQAVTDRPYLRSALNRLTLADPNVASDLRAHFLSQVLTGAMFDIVMALFAKYQDRQMARFEADPTGRKPSPLTAFWNTIQRMQTMAIQPLDLLPPCEATFRDYALAVLRAEQVANPTDPDGYRPMMIDVFIERGILEEADRAPLLEPAQVFSRPDLDVYHSIDTIGASRGSAYRFLDDNRAKLLIPLNADLIVTEIVRANKLTREARQLPEQIVIQYVWREEVMLEGERFGRFAGEHTSMLCGGTLVLDQNGSRIHWARRPGCESVGENAEAQADQKHGQLRRKALLDVLAARIEAGMVGQTTGGSVGILARAAPPFGYRKVDGALRFELSPHFSIHDDTEPGNIGGRQWQVSS